MDPRAATHGTSWRLTPQRRRPSTTPSTSPPPPTDHAAGNVRVGRGMTTIRLFIIAGALCLLTASTAAAQSITLTPSVVQLKGRTGQTTTQTLTIGNMTTRELSFVLEARDVVVRNGTRQFVAAGEMAGSIAATAVFSPRALVVR